MDGVRHAEGNDMSELEVKLDICTAFDLQAGRLCISQ